MLTLLDVTIRNFMSFGNNEQTIQLNVEGTTQILGEDRDTGLANGVGKSTILNAIAFALYDKPLSKIKKTSLPNRNNNDKKAICEVTLNFMKDGDHYQVWRTAGRSAKIEIYKNHDMEAPITKDSIANANKQIVDIVGISYELFKRTVVFSGGDGSFFDDGAGTQKAVMEELVKLYDLTKKAESLKDQIKVTKKDIEVEEAVLNEKKVQQKEHERMLVEAQNRINQWEDEKIRKLTDIQNALSGIQGIDFDEEVRLNDEYKTLLSEYELKNQEYLNLNNEVMKKDREKDSKANELMVLQKNLCPYCEQKYLNSQEKIEKVTNEIAELLKFLDENQPKAKDMFDEVDKLFRDLNTIKEKIKYDNIKTLLETKNSSDLLVQEAENLVNAENPHQAAYDSLKNSDKSKVDTKKYDDLQNTLLHEEFLLKLLTDKKSFIRKKLINKNLPLLNARLTHYLKLLGLAHIVTFNADLTPTITLYGIELDYGNLSGGEQKRLNLSLSLAFRDVRQRLHSKINILFTDEIDGGSLDTRGVEDVVSLILAKSKEDHIGVFVISHRPELTGKFDREMFLVKEGGFTEVESITDFG